MPKQTEEGYEILIYRLTDTDPSKIHFAEAIKAFCMFNDIRLSEDLLANGYIVVFDMKGVKLGHVTRVQLGPLRSFMAYIQEAHPARLKKIYICHAAAFVNQIMSLVRPLIKSEMMSLLQFTTKGPETLFPKELMPVVSYHFYCDYVSWRSLLKHLFFIGTQEYGGELGSTADYYRDQRKRLETVYRDWLIDSGKLKEKPKEKKLSNGKMSSKVAISPPIHSFNALEID